MTAATHLIEIVIEPKRPGETAQLVVALEAMTTRCSDCGYSRAPEFGRIILKVHTESQLNCAISWLSKEAGIEALIGAPQVCYRERLTKKTEIDYTYKKLVGGSGQFARVKLVCAPNSPDAGNQFEAQIPDGMIPNEFLRGVRAGVDSVLNSGVRAGFPVVDLKTTLVDAAAHDVDSSVLAFEIAARAATREALAKGGCDILEPIMRVEVSAPEEFGGSILGDMNSRRGEIVEHSISGGCLTVVALAPLANLFGYSANLASFTMRRGEVRLMVFSHYAATPDPENPDGHFPPALGMRLSA